MVEQVLVPPGQDPALGEGIPGSKGDSWGFWEAIYGVLFQPTPALRRLARERRLAWGLAVYLGVLLGWGLVLRQQPLLGGEGVLGTLAVSLAFLRFPLTLALLVLAVVTLFLQAGLYRLAAELFSSVGSGAGLLTTLGFSSLPGLLVVVGRALVALGAWSGFGLVTTLAALAWAVVLGVLALRETFALTTAQAVFIYLLPLLAVLVAVNLILLAAAVVA